MSHYQKYFAEGEGDSSQYVPRMSGCDPHEKALLQLWLLADLFAFKTHHGEKKQQHGEEHDEFGPLVRCVWFTLKINIFIVNTCKEVISE